jgi:HEAT repeat protein
MTTTVKRTLAIAIITMAAAAAAAQEPQVTDARREVLTGAAGLRRQIDAITDRDQPAAWIGWAVATTSRVRLMCCFDSWKQFERSKPDQCSAGCRLERENGIHTSSDGGTCVADHPWDRAFVLLRVARQRITRVRAFTPDCPLDAGGLPFYWLTDVAPEESVRLLASIGGQGPRPFRDEDDGDDLPDEALMALALHAHDSADPALEEFLEPGQPSKLRQQAAFWMAQERGRRGFETLRRLARDDKDARFREHLAFAISESRQPDAAEELVRMARTDRNPGVRGQAIFWLAQHAGRAAVSAITEAMENDPDVEVKKQAVFALSQLPPDEGVPLLIKIARAHRNFAVRKQAIFWLGESRDARALDFLEEIVLGANARPETE